MMEHLLKRVSVSASITHTTVQNYVKLLEQFCTA